MTEKPSTEAGAPEVAVLTVGEISRALKRMVEDSFAVVRVRGEITGFKRAASGHLYFSLKDPDAVLDAVCWRGTAARLRLDPEDGMEVIASGRLTTYPGRSKYQIVVESLELTGEGALLKLLEELKHKLAAEGLFDEDRKKPIPFLPEVIGIVTSPTGAVIRDIVHRIGERFPRRMVLWPVLVQGEGAAEQVAAAIAGFNGLAPGGPVPRPDVLIVARGGGSLEDLWAFNEEVVVRAAAASDIPLISAVGHETDITLVDFAADLRAPTPTAAAEMAVPVRIELLAQVLDDGSRLVGTVHRMLSERRTRVADLARGLPNLRRMVEEAVQRLDDWTERLRNGITVGLERRRARIAEMAARLPSPRQLIAYARVRLAGEARALGTAVRGLVRGKGARLAQAEAVLESCSYERVLERGFALVWDDAERPVRSVQRLAPRMALTVRFHDGAAGVTVNEDTGKGAGGTGAGDGRRRASKTQPGKPRPKPSPDDRQGTLL